MLIYAKNIEYTALTPPTVSLPTPPADLSDAVYESPAMPFSVSVRHRK